MTSHLVSGAGPTTRSIATGETNLLLRASGKRRALVRTGASTTIHGLAVLCSRSCAIKALGNRAAIDALIATHAVIYDARGRFYVLRARRLRGLAEFDLPASFRERHPVVLGVCRGMRK